MPCACIVFAYLGCLLCVVALLLCVIAAVQLLCILHAIVFRLAHNGINDGYKAYEANDGSHLDAPCTEDVAVEHRLIATATTHKDKTKNDNQHSYCYEDKVGLVESIISLVHFCLMFNV